MDTAIRPAFENDAKEIAWEEAHRPLGVIEQNQDEDIVRLTAAARARGVTQATIGELVALHRGDSQRLREYLEEIGDPWRARLRRAGLR